MNLFTEIGVLPELAAVLTELGYTAPAPIQEKVIPALLTGDTDRICLAQTGTGKTAAFGIPLVQLVDVQNRQPQALVLCLTRELCLQVATDLSRFGRKLNGIKVQPVYGGSPDPAFLRHHVIGGPQGGWSLHAGALGNTHRTP